MSKVWKRFKGGGIKMVDKNAFELLRESKMLEREADDLITKDLKKVEWKHGIILKSMDYRIANISDCKYFEKINKELVKEE